MIRDRAHLLKDLRRWFDERGYLEVQPPCLSKHAIVDPYIDPIEVGLRLHGDQEQVLRTGYLQTSPELYMKQLLSLGAPSLYGIVPAFREDEVGDLHRVEFTMLEWYQVNESEADGIAVLGDLACCILEYDSYEVLQYRKVFQDFLEIDPIQSGLSELVHLAEKCDPSLAHSMQNDRDGLLDLLLSEFIQPRLGQDKPVILRNYPLSQAALAAVSKDDPQCAARFELFVKGIEIANGYDELRDEQILQTRITEVARKRQELGRRTINAMPQSLVEAMSCRLPQCTGVALGVDRLHLLRSSADSLDEVTPYPS